MLIATQRSVSPTTPAVQRQTARSAGRLPPESAWPRFRRERDRRGADPVITDPNNTDLAA